MFDDIQLAHDIEPNCTGSADGTALGYYRRGTGPALVIKHGQRGHL